MLIKLFLYAVILMDIKKLRILCIRHYILLKIILKLIIQKTFKIIHLNQANKDEITKEQKFSSDKNLSSIKKKIIFNNLKNF